jgi:hypothetical protein
VVPRSLQLGLLHLEGRRQTVSLELSGQSITTEMHLRDIMFTLATISFFLLAIGYLRACERLK